MFGEALICDKFTNDAHADAIAVKDVNGLRSAASIEMKGLFFWTNKDIFCIVFQKNGTDT